MTEQEKDRILLVCNTLNANAGYFRGKHDGRMCIAFIKAEETILSEMNRIIAEEKQ